MNTSSVSKRRSALQHIAAWACLASLVGLAGCGTPVVADGGLLARADALLRAGSPGVVKLALLPDTLPTGATLAAQVHSTRSGSLYLYQVGTDGKTLNLVFPNEFDLNNTLPMAGVVDLPRPDWRLRARGPAGVGYMLAVVSETPQQLSTLTKAAADGRFQISGPYSAAMAHLTEQASR